MVLFWQLPHAARGGACERRGGQLPVAGAFRRKWIPRGDLRRRAPKPQRLSILVNLCHDRSPRSSGISGQKGPPPRDLARVCADLRSEAPFLQSGLDSRTHPTSVSHRCPAIWCFGCALAEIYSKHEETTQPLAHLTVCSFQVIGNCPRPAPTRGCSPAAWAAIRNISLFIVFYRCGHKRTA